MILSLSTVVLFGVPIDPESLYSEEIRIPYDAAGPQGLEALLIRPSAPGRYPLALLTHGSPGSADARREMSPWRMAPQAREFARRGWATVVVMRRGYGDSGGDYIEEPGCPNPDYVAAGNAQASDLRTAVEFLSTRPDVDGSRVAAVGASAGGYGVVALTADPPHGLRVAINLSGGDGRYRGPHDQYRVCEEHRLLAALRQLGRSSRVPMLWIYSRNDKAIPLEQARRFKREFERGGGQVEFVEASSFGSDGHDIFGSIEGVWVWGDVVDDFLRRRGLEIRREFIPLPVPGPELPQEVAAGAGRAFEVYRQHGPHKAFAWSPDGNWGWGLGMRTIEAARTKALTTCGTAACRVVAEDEKLVVGPAER